MMSDPWAAKMVASPSYYLLVLLCVGAVFLFPVLARPPRWSRVDASGVLLFALLLLGVLCASITPAKAANYPDQGQAYAGCVASLAIAGAHAGATPNGCTLEAAGTTNSRYDCRVNTPTHGVSGCNFWHGGTETNHNFPHAQLCSTRSNQFGWMTPPNQGGVCSQGCEYILTAEMDGTKYHSPTGAVCDTAEMAEPQIDTDGDGVADEDDAFPNDPNESADSDGDGIGDNADVAPDDATDGADDGEGDESDNTASGGGTCEAPPSCQGDGVACNTNFQVWKTRCATEGLGGKITGDPTNCNAGYTCTNNAVGCAQIAVMRAQHCSGNGPGDGPGNGTVSGGTSCSTPYVCTGGDPIACASLREQHKLRCDMHSNPGDDEWGFQGEPGEYFGVSESGSDVIDGIDAAGWLSGGTCPLQTGAISAFDLPGDVVELTCGALAALGVIVLMLSWLHAGMIVGRAITGGA